ncbi:MAG: DUF1553 domain-containing protein [Verrucomicrobiae bacterium]|nr:DUF1553 domain-containing protein [Verrucomicrobiae bacterium]
MMRCLVPPPVLGLALSLACLPATAATLSPEAVEFFEKRIRPVLASDCYECHGPDRQRGGLRLDFRQGLLDGGDSGTALIPGDPEASLLLQVIRHDDPDLAMPPKRPKLPDTAIADFTAWIRNGAPDPRDSPAVDPEADTSWDVTFKTRLDWWSFQPLTDPEIPAPSGTHASDHPVDRFLQRRQEELGLVPAPNASRPALIRRLTFALTGLPPTRDEIRAFLDDTSPDAYSRLVDRLLLSPRFGERWARHWMDLVRFAETHGSEGDPDIPNAWRYRDYLIRAFNADVPWDQLIREHVAGDLLASPRIDPDAGLNESILGTAHYRLVEHGFQPVDTLDEQVKTVDSQIDTLTKAFQGLTVSCARCHDHKFDPISQHDFQAVFSILASCRPTQVSIDLPERLRVHRDTLAELKGRIRHGLAEAWSHHVHQWVAHLQTLGTLPDTSLIPLPGDAPLAEIAALEHQRDSLLSAGRRAAWKARHPELAFPSDIPRPMAAWSFETDASDAIGVLHGTLHGNAILRDGRLVLDGRGAFLRTPPLDRTLREKTLEAWVAPATLDQRGGGVLSIETLDGAVFDSLVFAEQQPRQWLAGSDAFRRTRSLGGPEESASPDAPVHLAIVYSADHQIAVYRNGVPYGTAYTPSGSQGTLRTFETGAARVLLGLRHTGGGNPFFAGEIEEARLYDRALSPDQVQASFNLGPHPLTDAQILAALPPERRAEYDDLTARLAAAQAAFQAGFPDHPRLDARRRHLQSILDTAQSDPAHPLHAWSRLRHVPPHDFPAAWQTLRESIAGPSTPDPVSSTAPQPPAHRLAWNLAGPDANDWFFHGPNPPEALDAPGDFAVEPSGDRLLTDLWPAAIVTHRLSQKHNGVLTSPRFRVDSDFISVRAFGGHGARVRLISDHYPLGEGNIFPQATLQRATSSWVRLNTAYRRGTSAYLEFAPAPEVTARNRARPGPDGRSFFGVERIVFHDQPGTPPDPAPPLVPLWADPPPASLNALAERLGHALQHAIAQWAGAPDEPPLEDAHWTLLRTCLHRDLLPHSLPDLPHLASLVAEYRRLEDAIPEPRRAPGILETVGLDFPYFARGNPHQPGDPVPRGYLALVSGQPYDTPISGRLQLAGDIVRPDNPLTARVLANRIWHHLFGRGIVPTVDNFGRLGDPPSHPELLDHLATRFLQEGWSARRLIRYLVHSQTYQRASVPSPRAIEIDPDNTALSHMPVRRLEAEAIRDALLAVGGRLDTAMFGPGDNALGDSARRSVYLTIRRNSLSPFLDVFDGPKPFATLGRRDTTNVPAQSLALLNDPAIVALAERWTRRLRTGEPCPERRLDLLFEEALARPPHDWERAAVRAYLDDLATAHGPDAELAAWRDLAQSVFNLKEFIFIP